MIETTKQNWRKISKLGRNVGYEGKVTLTDEGLQIQFWDPADTIYVDSLFKKEMFDTYNPEFDTWKVDYSQFDKMFGRYKKKENVRVYPNGENSRLNFESDRKSFKVPQIDLAGARDQTLDLALSDSFDIDIGQLKEIVDDCGYVAQSLVIAFDEEIQVKAGEKASGSYQNTITDNTTGNTYNVHLKLDLLEKAISAFKKLGDECRVETEKDKAFKLVFMNNNIEAEAVIAPMMEDYDE